MRTIADDELSRMPLFAAADVVLFPNTAIPLQVSDPDQVALVRDCVSRGLAVAVTQQHPAGGASGVSAEKRQVATIGRIGVQQELPEGGLSVLIEGIERVRVVDESAGAAYPLARTERFPLEATAPDELKPRLDTLNGVAEALAVKHPRAARLLQVTLQRCADPGELSDVLCAITHEDVAARQSLLETSSVPARLDRVIETLSTLLLHVPLTDEDEGPEPSVQ